MHTHIYPHMHISTDIMTTTLILLYQSAWKPSSMTNNTDENHLHNTAQKVMSLEPPMNTMAAGKYGTYPHRPPTSPPLFSLNANAWQIPLSPQQMPSLQLLHTNLISSKQPCSTTPQQCETSQPNMTTDPHTNSPVQNTPTTNQSHKLQDNTNTSPWHSTPRIWLQQWLQWQREWPRNHTTKGVATISKDDTYSNHSTMPKTDQNTLTPSI